MMLPSNIMQLTTSTVIKNDSLYASGVLWAFSQSLVQASAMRVRNLFSPPPLVMTTIESSRLMVPAGLPGMFAFLLSGAG
jgi:hypothetical protein